MPRVLLITILLPTLASAAEPIRVPPEPLPPSEAARRDALTRYGVGLMRARSELPVQAVRQFEAAIRADPSATEPLRPLLQLYTELGRDQAAIRTARKILQADPADADTAHLLGRLLHDDRQFAEAARTLRLAAESPRVADQPAKGFGLLRDLARASAAAGDWSSAVTALQSADRLLIDHRERFLRAGTFPDAAELDREAAAVRERLGEALTSQKKFAESVAAFQSAHESALRAGDRIAAARLNWNLSGVLAAEGKTAEALTHLERFLVLGPSGAAPYERLAELLRRTGRPGEIAPALRRLADRFPTNPAIRWVLASELATLDPTAAARLFAEQAEKATDAAFFTRFLRFHKERREASVILATADRLFQAARTRQPEAVDRARAFVTAVKAEPGLAEPLLRQAAEDARTAVTRPSDTWELLAGLAEREGQLPLAEVSLRQAVRAGGSREVAALFLDVLAKQRKWEAIKTEAAAINARGQGRNLWYDVLRATAHAELGEDETARAIIEEQVVRLAVDSTWARRQKVRILNILGRHREAVAEAQALKADAQDRPGDLRQARLELSTSYLGLKRFAESEAELRAVLEDDPDDVLALNNLGYNLADQGRNLAEAEELIRRAIALDQAERRKAGHPESESGIYLDSLGWVLFRRGKLTEAREVLEKAARLPDAASDPVVWDHLGDVRFRLGDRAGARGAWEKAAELYVDTHQGRQGERLTEVRRKLKQTE